MTSLLKTHLKRTAVLSPGSIVSVNRTDLISDQAGSQQHGLFKQHNHSWRDVDYCYDHRFQFKLR